MIYGILHYDHSLTCHLWSSDPNIFLKRPKSARLDVWRLLPGLRPGPSSSLASTAAPFASNSSAAATWPLPAAHVQRRFASGGFCPGSRLAAVGFRRDDGRTEADASWRTTEVVGMLSSIPVQPTKERWMFWSRFHCNWVSFHSIWVFALYVNDR